MTFSFLHITLTEAVLLSALFFVFCYQIYYYLRYMAGICRRLRQRRKSNTDIATCQPPASIIVCARNEAHNLQDYLPALLEQQYPTYEVIVVNDASEDATQQVLDHYHQLYPHLRLTFVPYKAGNRGNKKLALTLAVKAAKYEYLLLTDADCRPESPLWLSQMMSGFTDNTEIVLGYGAYFERYGYLNRLIQYDTLFNGMQYLGMALARHPYMGVGRNLAYRKSTFFNRHGFAGMLTERAGDDDLFINKVADSNNTAVIVSPDSLTWSVPKSSYKEWLQQKRRHLSVSPKYRLSTRLRLLMEPLTRGIFYALLIAITVVGTQWSLIAAGIMLFLRWCCQLIIINLSAHKLGMRSFGLECILFDIYLPLNTLWLMLRNTCQKQQHW